MLVKVITNVFFLCNNFNNEYVINTLVNVYLIIHINLYFRNEILHNLYYQVCTICYEPIVKKTHLVVIFDSNRLYLGLKILLLGLIFGKKKVI